MRMKNTALLAGPYDWDPALVPLAEFEARLNAVRRVLAERGATALLVHGHSVEHGALAYLTGFVPKLGPAFALVPRDGPVRILASGGPGMMGSAKLLTWVEDVRPLGNLRNALGEWLGDMVRNGRVVLGLWGGNAMAQRPYVAVAAAIQPFGKIIEMDDPLDALRRHKSLREQELLREACRILAAACDAFAHATADGSGARSAALAAERAAYSCSGRKMYGFSRAHEMAARLCPSTAQATSVSRRSWSALPCGLQVIGPRVSLPLLRDRTGRSRAPERPSRQCCRGCGLVQLRAISWASRHSICRPTSFIHWLSPQSATALFYRSKSRQAWAAMKTRGSKKAVFTRFAAAL